MYFPLFIRHRLRELGTEQRDLAAAAQVTESCISQLLTWKKAPPAPERTDIYGRMETFLRLPAGKLAALADRQRTDALKRKLTDPPTPLFNEEPGLEAFLQDPSLRGDATAEELEFLKKLQFTRKRPTPLYYYRELQNLRDPLHFHPAPTDGSP